MKLVKNDGTSLELKVITSTMDMVVNYDLLPLSANKFVSVDRGAKTDRYACKFTFRGKEEYITSILNEINLLRVNQKSIILYDIDEPFFGDHINHTGQLDVTLYKIDKESSSGFNVKQVSIEFLLNSPVFNSNISELPTNMKCLQHKWEGYSITNTRVNETYNRQNYFVDRTEDRYQFVGTFTLSIDDTSRLLNYWRSQRGMPFELQESTFGIKNMFGSTGGAGEHLVVFKDITYSRVSSKYREVKITMIKVSN